MLQKRLVAFGNVFNQLPAHAPIGIQRFCNITSIGCKTRPNVLHTPLHIGSCSIRLINKEKARNPMLTQQLPHRFRLTFNSLHRANNNDGIIHRLNSTLHLGREINMTRRINQVVARISIGKHPLIRKHSNASLSFNFMTVQKGILMIHTTSMLNAFCIIKQLL
ncbi:hypothetical protein D3C74_374560 [compost metagenome]